MTECECELAGYCARHKLRKSRSWFAKCKTDQRYFEAWEAGLGPGQRTEITPRKQGPVYNHWGPLHYYAVEHKDNWDVRRARRFYAKWERRIPGESTCPCKQNWKRLGIKPTGEDFATPRAFFVFAWRAHNSVNVELERPIITLCDAFKVWGDPTSPSSS